MGEIRLGDFLEGYVDLAEYVANGMLYRFTYKNDFSSISLYVRFSRLLSFDECLEFERKLEKIFHVEKINLLCRYQPEMFSINYYNEL